MRLTNHVSFTKTDQYSSGVEITIIIPNGRTVSALRRTLLPLLPVNTAVIQLIVARYMGHELDYSQTSELKVNLDIPMKIVYSKFKEPPCMRNAALDIVVSGHVLFLDDDVIPDPSLLKNAVDLIVKDPMTVYQGPPYHTANTESALARLEGKLYERGFASYVTENGNLSLLDARIMLAPRSVFDDCPFNDKLIWGGEGRDLAERLLAKGHELKIAQTLRVKHINRSTLKELIDQKRAHGYGRGAQLRSDGFGKGGWTAYARRYYRRHFHEPLQNLFLGELPIQETMYTIMSNMLFWTFAIINYIKQYSRRD
jgi:hypothetical protein